MTTITITIEASNAYHKEQNQQTRINNDVEREKIKEIKKTVATKRQQRSKKALKEKKIRAQPILLPEKTIKKGEKSPKSHQNS